MMSTAWFIGLVSAAAFIALFLSTGLYTIIRQGRLTVLPPRGLLRCPNCSSHQVTEVHAGLSYVIGPDDEYHSRGFHYGLCMECGSRCARWIGDQAYIPDDEEWTAIVHPNKR